MKRQFICRRKCTVHNNNFYSKNSHDNALFNSILAFWHRRASVHKRIFFRLSIIHRTRVRLHCVSNYFKNVSAGQTFNTNYLHLGAMGISKMQQTRRCICTKQLATIVASEKRKLNLGNVPASSLVMEIPRKRGKVCGYMSSFVYTRETRWRANFDGCKNIYTTQISFRKIFICRASLSSCTSEIYTARSFLSLRARVFV